MLLDISLASGLLRVGHASQSLLLNWFDLLSECYIKKGESLNWVQKFSLWRCSPEEAAQFNPEMSVMEKDPGSETAGGHLKRSQAAVIISTTFRFCWQEQGMGVCLEAAGANLGSLRKPIWVLVLGRWGAGRRIATSDKTTSREPSCEARSRQWQKTTVLFTFVLPPWYVH